MGKTSLVRELLRRLEAEGLVKAIFVDLEACRTAEEAIAEIALRAGVTGGWRDWLRPLANRDVELKIAGQAVKLREAIRVGVNARQLATQGRPDP